MMRAAWAVLGVTLCCPACKSADVGQVAAAAITVGAAVAAAAVNRAATDECWGSCPAGSMCDGDSGLCVPLGEYRGEAAEGEPRWYPCDPERFECEADEWLVCDSAQCDWYRCLEGEPECTLSRPPDCPPGEDCAALAQGRVVRGAAPPSDLLYLDPCRGLCMAGERCVVAAGVADCVIQ